MKNSWNSCQSPAGLDRGGEEGAKPAAAGPVGTIDRAAVFHLGQLPAENLAGLTELRAIINPEDAGMRRADLSAVAILVGDGMHAELRDERASDTPTVGALCPSTC